MLSIHQWIDIWAVSAFGTLNNTTMNIWVEESVYFSTLLGIYLEMKLLGHVMKYLPSSLFHSL